MIERELRFTDVDMKLFAAGSGDTSPLHTNRTFAQSTSFGDCIVYGGLISIAMLGALPSEALVQVHSVRSSFPEPVLTGQRLVARAVEHPSRAGVWEVRLTGDEKLRARLVAETRRDSRAGATLARATTPTPDEEAGRTISGPYRSGQELRTLGARLGTSPLHSALLDGIGWASYLVGMGMPGFQGLCAAVDLTTASDDVPTDKPCAAGWARVHDHDPRTERRLLEGVLSDDADGHRTVAQIECFPIAVGAFAPR